MPRLTTQQNILRLRARGHSDTAIGRAVGRDSSLIAQIRIGKKPGMTLQGATAALRQAVVRRTPARQAAPLRSQPVPLRTIAGRTVRTRQPGSKERLSGTNIIYSGKRGYKTLDKEIRSAAKDGKGGRLTLYVNHIKKSDKWLHAPAGQPFRLHLFSTEGEDAQHIIDRLDAEGYDDNPSGALRALGLDVEGSGSKHYVEDYSGYMGYEWQTYTRNGGTK